ncbi:MAG: hypothetical protein QM811_18965 [Pirellulales bacterium]
MAAVIRATLDGEEFLYHSAKHDPKTDVAGLFSEFDLVTQPLGFEQAVIGKPFLKLGVGSLIKTTEKYQFYTQYPISKLAETRTTWTQDSVTFDQSYNEHGDYAYDLQVIEIVKENDLVITWKLTNTGRVEIKTQHYSHNSFRFNNQGPGPDYILSFPFDFTAGGLRADVIQDGKGITFTKVLEKPINIAINYPVDYQGDNSLTLINNKTQQQIVAATSVPGNRIALHIAPQYICPEQFVEIAVKPGESKTWERKYTFSKIGNH